ncbi:MULTISPECIES: hypothetical protein [Halobacteriovorax]|uniref:Uncharacterized protein n=1 Tax=Halobacteriovorax vibrionivorans TaxID=2152716 RepID=A0ABY0IP81_9BACT|nr:MULTISPECIES: hypothetical protein [Halobacteriovorax]AYF43260.1 hypothetical protein BALOs_0239 [Halobacteriovorax sp. BALOs_7]RZF23274.1 hypothetical protein DAY19_05760 [Halobacteriovorax vibrionivorans]TGD46127.1 hypothetical protein EP118_13445 [Halobacteriovorax sp. Y22]
MSENTNTNTTTETQASKKEPLPVKDGQFTAKTTWIIGFLILMLLVLKTFIYTKDKKRHGK